MMVILGMMKIGKIQSFLETPFVVYWVEKSSKGLRDSTNEYNVQPKKNRISESAGTEIN